MTDRTVDAFKTRNFAPWIDLWTDDAILQPPNAPTVVGRAGREAWSKAFPPLEQLRFGNVTVTGDGDVAYGTTTYFLKPQGMPADSGKQLFIARRQGDGRWKLVAGSFNSDLPAPGAPAAAPTLAGEPRGAASAGAFTAADSLAIVALNGRLVQAARSHHWDAWGAEYAANPMRMPPNAKTIAGKSAVDAFNHSAPNVSVFELKLTSMTGNGAMAVTTGEYRAVAPSVTEDGKFMQQLARQPDGTWKIVRDIWNSNVPSPAAK
jgi:ketosteroid isomerase-like protein